MYIGMRGHDFNTGTIAELSEKCKEHGVGGVQLVLMKSISDFKQGMFTPEYATSIGDELKRNGIRVPILGCYINPSDTHEDTLKANMDYFIENLHYAKYIGADMVGLETGFVGDTLDVEENATEEAYQYLLKNMSVLVRAAEEIGVTIGIEGVHCFVINNPKRMKRLVDDLNSKNVCVIFDPVNYLTYENYEKQDEMINEHFDLLGDKTKALHLKDFKIVDKKVCYENPCRGLLNKDLILKRLKEVNPDCPVILEETVEDKLPAVKAEVEEKF